MYLGGDEQLCRLLDVDFVEAYFDYLLLLHVINTGGLL